MATYLEYTDAALSHARIERMESGKYYASIPDFDGLSVMGDTEEDARRELRSALDGWIDVQVKIGHDRVPVVDGIDLFAPPKFVDDHC